MTKIHEAKLGFTINIYPKEQMTPSAPPQEIISQNCLLLCYHTLLYEI